MDKFELNINALESILRKCQSINTIIISGHVLKEMVFNFYDRKRSPLLLIEQNNDQLMQIILKFFNQFRPEFGPKLHKIV